MESDCTGRKRYSISNITTLVVPPPVGVPLTSYKPTIPESHNFVTSGAVGISDAVGNEEQVWSPDNPAPMGGLTASLQLSTAAAILSTAAAWFPACMGIRVGLALQ